MNPSELISPKLAQPVAKPELEHAKQERLKLLAERLKRGGVKPHLIKATLVVVSKSFKHGLSDSPEYGVWAGMKRRCYNSHEERFPRYGGRGIRVCNRWLNDFLLFLADMGPRPFPGATINRKNNDGDYEPGNCNWKTKKEQARNTSRNQMMTLNGQTKCMSEWAEELGIPVQRIWARKEKLGWNDEDALRLPRVEKLITYKGQTMNVSQWEKHLEINNGTIRARLLYGWTVEKALSTSV